MVPSEKSDFYFNFQVASLKFLGIDILAKQETFSYKIYSAFTLSFTAVYVFVECIELIYHTKFEELNTVCNYAISHFLGMIKVIIMYRNRKQIGDVIVSLHEGVYKPDEKRGGKFEKKCIKKNMKLTKILMWMYALPIISVISLGIVTTIHIRFTKGPEFWRLPFTYISLVNTYYSPNFEFAYLYQLSGIFMITLCVYTIDVTVTAVIALATAHIKILENSVRNYVQRGLGSQKKIGLSNEESVDQTLKETINDHHCGILDTIDKIEDLVCYLALSVFLANVVLLCLLMYNTSTVPIGSVFFFMYLLYWFLIALQVFMYCYWGNELTVANDSLALTISQTYTPDVPTSHAKALVLMMTRSQRKLCLTAGKFTPLSLETYKAVIKGSFSYFMVLRQVNSK